MKKISFVFALLLLSGWTTWAADNFVVKIRGTLTGPNGQTRIKETDLVVTNGQRLVLQIDATNHSVVLVQTDATGTNVVRQEAHAEAVAVTSGHRAVTFDLQPDEGFAGNTINQAGLTGRLLVTGRIAYVRGVARSFRGTVFGIWNGDGNSTFKGTITGQRVP